MTTGTISDEVRDYLEAVRARLADVPADEREHLLSDVEAALLDGGAAELGPPERFADELRAAAGLPPFGAVPAATPAAPSATERLADRLARLKHDPHLRRIGYELAPLWWLARGYLALIALAVVNGVSWPWTFDLFPIVRDARATILVLLALCTASVLLGMRRRRHAAITALNVVLALFIPLVVYSVLWMPGRSYADPWTPAPAQGLALDGADITNVYAYDRRGRLLQDVRLYDQSGRPLDVGVATDPDRRVPVTTAGHRALNAFPVRYYESGTHRVAHPGAGVPVHPRPIVTRPVR